VAYHDESAAEAPRQPRDLFETLAESAPDAILTIDAESTILFANSATERIFGHKPEELKGKSLSVLIPERLRAAHDAGIARYLQSGRRNISWTGIDLTGLTRSGAEIPVEISFGEFRGADGEIIFSGFIRDVSERVRQQAAVDQARADADRAFAEMTRLGRVTDVALAQTTYDEMLQELLRQLRKEIDADEATVLLLDEATNELSVKAWDGLGSGEDLRLRIPIGRGITGKVASSGTPLVLDDIEGHEVLSPTIRDKIKSVAAVPVKSEGQVIGVLHTGSTEGRHFSESDMRLLEVVAERMAGVFVRTQLYDAERKARAEAEEARAALAGREELLNRTNGELRRREQEERSLRRLAQSITGAVRVSEVMYQIAEGALNVSGATGAYVEQVASPDGEVEIVASAGEGTPPIGQRVPYPGSLTEEIIEAREPIYFAKMEGVGAAMAPYLDRYCHGCSVLLVPLLTETTILGTLALLRRKDEKEFEASAVSRVRTLGDLASLSLQRLVALAESERRRNEAEAAVRSRDEVLSIVSHDLRNPVSTVSMSAALLGDPNFPLSEPDRAKQVAVIARSAQRMNRLIQDLLDVARIEGGRLSISCRCEAPQAIATEAVEAFRPIASERGIVLDCRIGSEFPRINADRDRILQVLSNYLNNAVKFTPKSGTVTVEAKSFAEENEVVFSVSDTGPGIPEEDLKNAFNRFWQAKATAHLGSGLGLAIARGIAEAHGGRVWVDSTVGSGSTFFLAVPYSDDCNKETP